MRLHKDGEAHVAVRHGQGAGRIIVGRFKRELRLRRVLLVVLRRLPLIIHHPSAKEELRAMKLYPEYCLETIITKKKCSLDHFGIDERASEGVPYYSLLLFP
jgi:hypothetical protein